MRSAWPQSLRSRLTASYVAVLVLAMLLFGSAAVVVIDHDLRASLDDRLQTTARASLNFVVGKDGRVAVEEDDREQLFSVLAPQINLAVVGNGARLVFSTVGKTYPEIVAAAAHARDFVTIRHAGMRVRTLVVPITRDGQRLGTVMAWANTDWIVETDQRVVAAFAGAALLLALVASLTGGAATRGALADAFQRQQRFTADASHELRAPLSVIRAEADLALRKPRAAPEYQAALETIAQEADQMEKLVGELLTAARAQDGHAERTVFDLCALAQRVCARLRPAADIKQVTITLAQDQACAVRGDMGALERAVTAVLHNAIKYARSGGRIDVRTSRRRKAVELSVHDDGSGFSPQALVHAAEWFWCGDSERGKGTGLGLALANRVVQAGGGRLALANAADGGAEVQIWLPAR